MVKKTTHAEQLVFLRRIEGQIRGIQKMIEEERYCVDILTQLHSVAGAIFRVEDKVLKKHLEGCVVRTLSKGTLSSREKKIEEIVDLLKRFRKAI
ncbi:MAG: metal-sensitive transcriptional regulator [Candidatus Omnitrophota bacterium]